MKLRQRPVFPAMLMWFTLPAFYGRGMSSPSHVDWGSSMTLAPHPFPEVFLVRSSVCVHISPCHLHHDKAAQPINLSTAFFCLMPAFITHLSSMSDHLGEKKLGYRPGTFTILAHWPLSFLFFCSLCELLASGQQFSSSFSSLFNFLHHCRNTKL